MNCFHYIRLTKPLHVTKSWRSHAVRNAAKRNLELHDSPDVCCSHTVQRHHFTSTPLHWSYSAF